MTIFQQRAVTASIFSIVMLTGLFWHELTFNMLFLIILLGCQYEFLKLIVGKNIIRYGIAFVISLILWLILSNNSIFLTDTKWLELAFIPLFVGLFTHELFSKSTSPFQNIGGVLTSFMYIVLPFSLICSAVFTYPNQGSFTPNIVAGILFLTWANDSFAYIIGSKIGKTPLFPRISPKKTWEGTIGGIVCCIITAAIISHFFKQLTLVNWLVIGGIVGVFGTLGDLIESQLKRSVGVKDSGNFMPGHGGFLDRFDAFLFCIPIVYFYLNLLRG